MSAPRNLLRQDAISSDEQLTGSLTVRGCVGDEFQAAHLADEMSLDRDFALCRDDRRQIVRTLQMLHQKSGAAVHEALGNPIMECIGQFILDADRSLLPMNRVVQPTLAMGDIGPGADMGNALYQRIDLAVEPVECADLFANPFGR